MKIKTLKLHNIGPYYSANERSVHEINFDTKYSNLIVIGGKNGGGKTTILNSLKLAMLGEYIRGYNTKGKSYYDIVKTRLNNRALSEKNAKYFMEIEFSIIENYNEYNYLINREFLVKNDRVSELTKIFINGKLVTNVTNVQEKIGRMFPLSFLELYFLDGEDIPKIVSTTKLKNYIKNVYELSTCLDQVSTMQSDLNLYTKNYEQQLLNTEMGQSIASIRATIKNIDDEITKTSAFREAKEAKILDLVASIDSNKDKILSEINSISKDATHDFEEINDFLKSIMSDSTFERKYINSILTEDIIGILNFNKIEKIENNIPNLKNKYFIDILRDAESIHSDLNLSDTISVIESRTNDVSSTLLQYSKELETNIEESNYSFQEYAEKKEKLLKVFSTSRKGMISKIKKLDNTTINNLIIEIDKDVTELSELETIVFNLSNKIDDKLHKKNDLLTELSVLSEKVHSQNKSDNGYKTSFKIIEVLKLFTEQKRSNDFGEINKHAIEMFHNINRKEDFIEKLEINPETFELSIYARNDVKINYDLISAGEKQLLLLSIIWGIHKLTKKKQPFVLDSFLGRMDSEHRKTLLDKFVKNCGEQVIILATNEEIKSIENLEYERAYVLTNNSKASSIKEGYFE
jgi:DNA sulfur modification protein DndD